MPQFVKSGFRKAIVLRNKIMTPMKPNSAKRQVVQVVIPRYGYKMYAYVPYKKYPLQKWNRVMITTHWSCDVGNVKCRAIRGKFDLPTPDTLGACRKRSKFCAPPIKKIWRQDVTLTKYITPKAEEPSIYDYDI